MDNYYLGKLMIREADCKQDPALRALMETAGDHSVLNGVHSLINASCADGEFDEIESYCIEWRIAFDRDSEGNFDILPEKRIFRPGDTPTDTTYYLTSQGEPFVTCNDLLWVLEDSSLSEHEIVQKVLAIIRKNDFSCALIDEYLSPLEVAMQRVMRINGERTDCDRVVEYIPSL